MDGTISEENKTALATLSKSLTAHSCRYTMLDAAVHAGRSAQEIGLPAHPTDASFEGVLYRALIVDFDQCMFGAPSMKPTRLLVTHCSFLTIQCKCQGGHRYVRLKGKVWSQQFKKWVFRTKLAQEYPWQLCQAMADAVVQLRDAPLQHLRPSFELQGDVQHRKRPLGLSKLWKPDRQERSAGLAQASGYQLRGAVKPLLNARLVRP